MKKRFTAFLMAVLMAIPTGITVTAADTYIEVTPANGTVSVQGNLGGKQNNRIIAFYTSDDLSSASYIGSAEAEYTGEFISSAFPLTDASETLIIRCGDKTWTAPLNQTSHIDITAPAQPSVTPAVFGENPFNLPTSYPAITSTTTYDRFLEHKAELPDELPVIEPAQIGERGISFYVSPKGSDKNDGSIDSPFATLRKAVSAVASLTASEKKTGVNIYLRGGRYCDAYTISMINEHSGTAQYPLYISAYEDEDVILEHGTVISGSAFRPVGENDAIDRIRSENRDNMYVVDLDDVGISDFGNLISENNYHTPQLSKKDGAMHVARYPNTETLSIEKVIKHGRAAENYGENFTITDGVEFVISDERPQSWVNQDIAIHGGIGMEWYPVDIHADSISYNSSAKAWTVASNDNPREGAVAANERDWVDGPTWYYWYNILEETDTDSEWYLDRNSGKLYVYCSENISNQRYTYSLGTNNILSADNLSNVIFNGITFANNSGDAVYLDKCKNILFQNCNISNNMSCGIVINDSKQCGVVNCLMIDNGDASVKIDGNSYEYMQIIPCHNYVQNCYISRPTKDSNHSGVSVGRTVAAVVSHNLFQNFDSHALSTGGLESIFEYNEFVNTDRKINDMGSVYWSSYDNFGLHMRYNYLHAPYDDTQKKGLAFYADELSSNSYVYGNIIDGYARGFKTHGGQNMTFSNNLIKNSKYSSPSYFEDSKNFWDKDKSYWNSNVWSNMSQGIVSKDSGFGAYYSEAMLTKKSPWKDRYPEVYEYTTLLDTYTSDVNSNGNKSSWNGTWGKYGTLGFALNQWKVSESEAYTEARLRAPKGHVITDNVSYNNGSQSRAKLNSYFDLNSLDSKNSGNKEVTSDPGLVDGAGNSLPFNKMGLSTLSAEWKSLYTNGVSLTSPINGGKADVTNGVVLKWKETPFASRYTVTVSENSDLSAPVLTATTENNILETNLLSENKTYYWSVTSHSDAKQFENITADSDVYLFTTGNSTKVVLTDVNITESAVEFKVSNGTDTKLENLTAYYAIYSADNALQYVSCVPVSVQNKTVSEKFTLPAVNKEGIGYILLWDKNNIPYTDPYPIDTGSLNQ